MFIAVCAIGCCAASIDDQKFNGRWDVSVNGSPSQRAWWLEVSGAGTSTLKGKFVGFPVGHLEEIPKLSISDGELRFALDSRYRRERPQEKGLYWARLEDGKLKGTFEIEGDPSSYLEWIGVRAPVLPDKDDGTERLAASGSSGSGSPAAMDREGRSAHQLAICCKSRFRKEVLEL